MKSKLKKILFIQNASSSFVINDLSILKKYFPLKVFEFKLKRKTWRDKVFFYLELIFDMLWSDLVFIWFADKHAYKTIRISELMRKKSIVVVGGYEVARVPELQYGLLLQENSSEMVQYILHHASKIVAVSQFSREEIVINSGLKNTILIYNGIDINEFKPAINREKENIVISIAFVHDIDRIKLKGLNTFVSAAKLLPEIKFIMIGMTGLAKEHLEKISPPNLELIEPVEKEKIIYHCQKAKVYCQLSFRESFGVALVEAMACECVPVVTDTGALPEIVGNTGFIVSYGDIENTARAIREAIVSDKGESARNRVLENFTLEKRERALVGLINSP